MCWHAIILGEFENRSEYMTKWLILIGVIIILCVAEWMRDYITHRQSLSYSWRSDPRLDCLDVIGSRDAFTDNNVIMTKVDYSYNGAFRGSGEGRVI